MRRSNIDLPDVFSFVKNPKCPSWLECFCIHNHPTHLPKQECHGSYFDFVLMQCPSCLLWVRDFRFILYGARFKVDWYNTEYLHDILSVPNNIESFVPFPKKIKMHSWSVWKYFQRILFVLAYVTVSYIAATKCATYEVTIIFKLRRSVTSKGKIVSVMCSRI